MYMNFWTILKIKVLGLQSGYNQLIFFCISKMGYFCSIFGSFCSVQDTNRWWVQRHLSLLTWRVLQTFLLAGVNHFQIKVSHFLAFQQYISKYLLFWRFEVCVPSTILVFEWCIILCNFDSSSCIGIWRTSFLFYFECCIKSQSCAQLLTQHGVEGRLKQKWGMCVKHSSSFIFVPSIINILCIFSRRGWLMMMRKI